MGLKTAEEFETSCFTETEKKREAALCMKNVNIDGGFPFLMFYLD